MGWSLYIVECADKSLYTGISTDVPKRVATHNVGKGAKYTRSRLPVKLLFSREVPDQSYALRLERQVKSSTAEVKRRFILIASYRCHDPFDSVAIAKGWGLHLSGAVKAN